MKISVVMATYNGEKYVEKQLYSLLNQSVAIDEVIIADDKGLWGDKPFLHLGERFWLEEESTSRNNFV